MRTALLLAVSLVVSPLLCAQRVAVFPLPPGAYGVEALFWFPRGSLVGITLPAGDTLWVGNLPADSTVRRDSTCVQATRLRVLAPGDTVVTVELWSRTLGRGAETPGLRVPLRDGSTFVVTEVYRRFVACGDAAGYLVAFLKFEAPPRP